MTSRPVLVVHIHRHFDAPAERVFDAWLEPATLGRWMFGPEVRNEEIVRLDVDARVGGRFSFVVRRGEEQIDHVGEYEQIDRPRHLVFTWIARPVGALPSDDEPSRVSIEITPRCDGCDLALTHRIAPKWAGYAARTQAGWVTMLEALARYLAPQR